MDKFFESLLESIGEDTQREGLKDTPLRAAESFKFLTKGYKEDVNEIVNNAIFTGSIVSMLIESRTIEIKYAVTTRKTIWNRNRNFDNRRNDKPSKKHQMVKKNQASDKNKSVLSLFLL